MKVFCYVAQRMTTEGSEKTWDQCRIKLKNLKSQYRYVKDRIPNIDEVDLEDDEVILKKNIYLLFFFTLQNDSCQWTDTCFPFITLSLHRSHLNKGCTHLFEL